MVWTRGGEGFGGEGECGDVVGPAEELAEVATQLRGAEEMDGRDAAALEVEKGGGGVNPGDWSRRILFEIGRAHV